MKRALRMLVLCLLVTPATGFANSPKDLAHADFTADQTSGCSSFIVQFTDQSVAPANDPITQYKWIFGDGSESDEVNPAHQFLSAGIFNIKLVITSQSGWKDSVTRMNYIQVNPSPIVNIGADTVVCDGSIMFLDAGNPGATYQWNTGDMFQEIQAYWAGEYWVEVTANGCSTRDTILIFSVPGLYADYTQTESEGCLPSTVTFQNLSSTCGGTLTETYWDFGDGTSSTEASPVHQYTETGEYYVTLRIKDNVGSVTSTTHLITVRASTIPLVQLGNDTTVCEGNSLILSAGFPGASYLWNTGETTEQITITDPGNYSVMVSVNGTCTGADTISIAFSAPITALYTHSVLPGCAPIEVQFTDHSSTCSGNSIIQWDWDFGDGATSSIASPLHAYTIPATYTVTLTVTTVSGLTSVFTSSVVVTGIPINVSLGADTTFCESTFIRLNANITGATYLWSTGENTQSIVTNLPGKYWVRVLKNNCYSSDTIILSMQSALTPAFGYTFETLCLPVRVKFTDSSVSCVSVINTWQWDFGDGTFSTLHHPVHIYTSNGNYVVRLTITDIDGNSITKSRTVQITSSLFSVNIGKDTTICYGNLISLDAGNPGSTYLWNTGEASRTVNVSDPGKYWVRVAKSGCVATDTITIKNIFPVTPAFGYTINSKCLPVIVNFTDSSSVQCGGSISKWRWDFGDGNTSSLQHPVYTYTKSDTFNVKLTITAANGVMTSKTRRVYIENSLPLLNLGPDLIICKGTITQLDANIPDASYIWTPAGSLNNTTVRNPIASPLSTTLYTVEVTKCMRTLRDSILVRIDSLKRPVVVQDNSNMLRSSLAESYQWFKDEKLIPGATGRTYTAKSLGFYTVRIRNSLGCENVSLPFLYIPKGRNGVGLNGIRIHCSPNPTNGIINIVFESMPEKGVQLTIVDRYGKAVVKTVLMQQYNQLKLYTLSKGQYFFELKLDKEKVVIAVVIQ